MDEQIQAFSELADELLTAGRVDDLVRELSDPDLADEWDDPAMVAVVARAYGRHAAGGRLLDVAVLRVPEVSLLLALDGRSGSAVESSGDELVLDGVVRGPVATDVACVVGDEVRLVASDGLVVRSVAGLDPDAGLHHVTGRVPLADARPHAVGASAVVTRAARFLAHELLGVADAAQALALDHVRERRQFGVPIGTFQAVRHRLAQVHVETVAAEELLAAYGPEAGVDVHVLVLKSAAGVAARAAVAAAQQVCGGMGFTDEFGLHRFVRRALFLDGVLGGSEDADTRLGALALVGQVEPDRKVVLS